MHDRLFDIWYGGHPLGLLLWPLSLIYRLLVGARRLVYRLGLLPSLSLPVPLIVVGNISVGGTGKTPLVIWISRFLCEKGYRPGVVTRGYGGQAKKWPQQVRADSDALMVGDEAVVIARRAAVPVAAGPDRYAAARALIERHGCDIIVSDDGLQHYRLNRDIEIAVIDGVRRHGNGRCLPAGPLREPLSRLKSVDMMVTNGIAVRGEFAMKYIAQSLQPVAARDIATPPPDPARGAGIHAIAATGNPDRFFESLRQQGFRVLKHAFADHYVYRREDVDFADELPVVMTEKDAVKCLRFAGERHWYQPIEAQLPPAFEHRLLELLKRGNRGQTTA